MAAAPADLGRPAFEAEMAAVEGQEFMLNMEDSVLLFLFFLVGDEDQFCAGIICLLLCCPPGGLSSCFDQSRDSLLLSLSRRKSSLVHTGLYQ
jgi:hypothetical protein